jgi:hypothetical protein
MWVGIELMKVRMGGEVAVLVRVEFEVKTR